MTILTDDELKAVRERAKAFDAKIAETNRVDVWPACEFDRSKLLRHIDALEKDAARYQWLRGNGAIIARHAAIPVEYAHFGIGLDAAIDAAKEREETP